MAKKLPKMKADQASTSPLPRTVKDSAQQIWLAGLGAFAKAQEQGSQVFEALVREGLTLQHKIQTAAEEKIAETSSHMSAVASLIQSQTDHRKDKLETIFEDRVAKALNRLGIPSATEMNAMVARLDQLNKHVQQMNAASAASAEPLSHAAPQATTRRITRTAARQKASSATKSANPLDTHAENPTPAKRIKTRKSS